jgi:uncharacterized protein YodC (DUF2158 family)
MLGEGDFVILRSGGPIMTVLSVGDDNVLCEWTGEDGRVVRNTFYIACLWKLVDCESWG